MTYERKTFLTNDHITSVESNNNNNDSESDEDEDSFWGGEESEEDAIESASDSEPLSGPKPKRKRKASTAGSSRKPAATKRRATPLPLEVASYVFFRSMITDWLERFDVLIRPNLI